MMSLPKVSMRTSALRVCFAAACMVACLGGAQAQQQWVLNGGASHFYMQTSKAESITEIHQFTGLAGTIDGSGNADVKIDLTSVSSGIDVRDVTAILDGVRADLSLSEPTCLVVGYLLHFFTPGAARDLVARYTAALAPGSCLALSVLHATSQAAHDSLSTYSSEAAPVYSHPVPEIASFFGPLELVPPGLVDARRWRPDWDLPRLPPRENQVIAGVARKG